MAREPRRGDPIPCVAEDAATAAEDVESDVAPSEVAPAPDAEIGVGALERAAAPDAERAAAPDAERAAAPDAEIGDDEMERAIDAERDVDELEGTVGLISALLSLSVRRPSASGAGYPWHCSCRGSWHCGCRGPSP